jgi:hypothetical protein
MEHQCNFDIEGRVLCDLGVPNKLSLSQFFDSIFTDISLLKFRLILLNKLHGAEFFLTLNSHSTTNFNLFSKTSTKQTLWLNRIHWSQKWQSKHCNIHSLVVALYFLYARREHTHNRENTSLIQEISLISKPLRRAPGFTQPPIQCVPGAVSSGIKRQGGKADHSSPSSAKVKNGGAILPLPHSSSWLGA